MNAVTTQVPLRMFMNRCEYNLTAAFTYDTSEPYEVRFTFGAGLSQTAVWIFARSLLSDGLNELAGNGDVRVWPHSAGSILNIMLLSPSGSARFEAPAAAVARFVDATRLLVPEGDEPDH